MVLDSVPFSSLMDRKSFLNNRSRGRLNSSVAFAIRPVGANAVNYDYSPGDARVSTRRG